MDPSLFLRQRWRLAAWVLCPALVAVLSFAAAFRHRRDMHEELRVRHAVMELIPDMVFRIATASKAVSRFSCVALSRADAMDLLAGHLRSRAQDRGLTVMSVNLFETAASANGGMPGIDATLRVRGGLASHLHFWNDMQQPQWLMGASSVKLVGADFASDPVFVADVAVRFGVPRL